MKRFINKASKLFVGQHSEKRAEIESPDLAIQRSVRAQILDLSLKAGILDEVQLRLRNAEDLDRYAESLAFWLSADVERAAAQTELLQVKEEFEELQKERASVAALIREGPSYPWYTTIFALVVSLIPGFSFARTLFYYAGIPGMIAGLMIGFIIYFVLEKFYKHLIHADLLKAWGAQDPKEPKRKQLRIRLTFLTFIFFDILLAGGTVAAFTLRSERSLADVSVVSWGLLFLAVAANVLFIFFLYSQVPLDDWVHLREYCRENNSSQALAYPREHYHEGVIETLRELEERKKQLEKDTSEWSDIADEYSRMARNCHYALFADLPITLGEQGVLEIDPDEIFKAVRPLVDDRVSSKYGRRTSKRYLGASRRQLGSRSSQHQQIEETSSSYETSRRQFDEQENSHTSYQRNRESNQSTDTPHNGGNGKVRHPSNDWFDPDE